MLATMTLVIADMFGVPGERSELLTLLAKAERTAMSQDGCLRYTVATSLADPDHYVVVEEWRDEAALEAHYSSVAFKDFQFTLYGLLARPSEAIINATEGVRRPVTSGPMDPRDAD
jgi:quinol monooxygenase YgiN